MLEGFAELRRMLGPTLTDYSQTLQQGYRVADTAVDLYELYVGEDASPDFMAGPVATSAMLPFSWSPSAPAIGTKKLHIVVRKRNAYDLQSHNVYETVLEIDTGGVELGGPLTAPKDVATYDVDAGEIRVLADYLSDDDVNPADTWEVYATVGSDPVPGVDSPVYSGLMALIGNTAVLNTILTGYSVGNVVHVIVTAMRASDSERASASVVLHTVPAAIDVNDGYQFGGNVYEQR
jgi:hypothetical protein